MSDGNNGSAAAGSPIAGPTVNLNNPGASVGQPQGQGTGVNYEEQYRKLEEKLGAQGMELGEYRQFFQNISPLLDKLDQAPTLVQGILDGKIDDQLVTAVLDGRISVKDAQDVTKAHQEVKKEIGQKGYGDASPEAINKMVEDRVQKMRRDFEQDIELKAFEDKTQKFIENTKDFVEYADGIDKWLDSHDVTDVEVAYWAVKGRMSEATAQKKAEEDAAERAKDLALNAMGGGVTTQYFEAGSPVVDKLISGSRNPNVF